MNKEGNTYLKDESRDKNGSKKADVISFKEELNYEQLTVMDFERFLPFFQLLAYLIFTRKKKYVKKLTFVFFNRLEIDAQNQNKIQNL